MGFEVELLIFFLYMVGVPLGGFVVIKIIKVLKDTLLFLLNNFDSKSEINDDVSSSNFESLNMLDEYLRTMDLQVIPKTLGNFDTGDIQSLVDLSMMGEYRFEEYNNKRFYIVSIVDKTNKQIERKFHL